METTDLQIATITLVRNFDEEALLKASLNQLSACGIPVIVTDGGSPTSFLEFVRNLPHFTLLPNSAKGVFMQARSSLTAAQASGRPFIFYTEPDKKEFFETGLQQFLQNIKVDTGTGIVTASRSANGFTSFPLFQQMTETAINNCCGDRTGLEADYCYGPFLLNSGLVPFLSGVQDDIGWGWRPYLFHFAHRLGYTVEAYEGDFFCPADQRQDDAAERLYRMKQLEQNIRGLVMAAGVEIEGAKQ
jgi:hypothetical protein